MASDLPLPDPRPATADLLSSLEDLELSNRRLAGENAKLQRSVETAEEGSARLGEEIAALRKQLRRWAGSPVSLLTRLFSPTLTPVTLLSTCSLRTSCPVFNPALSLSLLLFFFCVSLVLVSWPLGFRLPSSFFSESPYQQPIPFSVLLSIMIPLF